MSDSVIRTFSIDQKHLDTIRRVAEQIDPYGANKAPNDSAALRYVIETYDRDHPAQGDKETLDQYVERQR